MSRQIISTDKAPAAIGPYSQAVLAGNTLYLAGQIPIDPATGQLTDTNIKTQTHQVFKNIQAVLAAAGFSMADVVQAQVFLKDLNDFGAMNEVYAEYFTADPPTRAAVEVSRLPRDCLIEIMVTAKKNA